MEEKLRESGLPLVSLETQTPLCDFDVVGFSLQYELEYTNILTMLDLGGIAIYARDRDENAPLVIGGGPCAFNPEPVADFFDCFLLGDGEEAFPEIIAAFITARNAGMARKQCLLQLAHIPGVYVPALYRTEIDPETGFIVVRSSGDAPYPVKRTYIENINDYPFPDDILVPHGEIVHDRVAIEIARGCTEGCRFCQAGTIYRPVRERKPRDIIATIMRSLDNTGFDQASLTSLSTADFSCIGPLAEKLSDALEKRRTAMSVSSMRVYGMTDSLGESLSKIRRSGFTIAPEAGSQRMRDVINKGITEEVILEGAKTAFSNGWAHIKLYFMIGLPTETQEDLKAIVDLGKKILFLAERFHGKKAQVTISVSSHIPKPHAPFQWLGFEDIESLREKQKYLLQLIQPYRRLRFKWHDVNHSWLEAIFSRGDRRLSKAIALAYDRGCRFDAWTDQIDVVKWREVFEYLQIETEIWMRDIALYAPLPWDHIDSLVKKEWLIGELKKAMKGRFSPACEKPYKNKHTLERTDLGHPGEDDKLVCYHCGLNCDLNAIRNERIASWNSLEQESGIDVKTESVADSEMATPADVTRYRASFCKLDDFRFLSTLDLTRTFTRAFVRSGVPLKYSEGFHPSPVIAFGPALAVGIESVDEYLDFETVVEIKPEHLCKLLNKQLPEGLRINEIFIIARKALSLFNLIDTAEYSVDLENCEFEHAATPDNEKGIGVHRDLITEMLSAEHIMVEKKSKGKTRVYDIKPLIKKIEVVNSNQPLQLRMLLCTGARGNLRPVVVLNKIYGEAAGSLRIRRERLLVDSDGRFASPGEIHH
jgi:radical SAM family uncharacterized protein/radical SAM-linked protein